MGKVLSTVCLVLLVVNMFFNSGLAFAMSGKTMPDTPDTVYSPIMTGPDTPDTVYSPIMTGLIATYTQGDFACADWLLEKTVNNPVWVKADYNAQLLLLSTGFKGERVDYKYSKPHYLWLTSQDIGKMVYGKSPGLRYFEEIPNLSKYTEVFSKDGSRIYVSRD